MPTPATSCRVCGRELGLNNTKCLICGSKQTMEFLEDYPPKENFGEWTKEMFGNKTPSYKKEA